MELVGKWCLHPASMPTQLVEIVCMVFMILSLTVTLVKFAAQVGRFDDQTDTHSNTPVLRESE